MTGDAIELSFHEHLTDADRRLLARTVDDGTPLSAALSDPRVEAAVFAGPTDARGLAATSPFLTFAVAVHRTAARLRTVSYVEEAWAPGQRVPVFDVTGLRELAGDPAVRFFLVELLASYTHLTSGATWERTRRGWRRRRFSELDPVLLAGLLEVVGPHERAGVYRRLGDLALFLTGVFPDHTGSDELHGAALARLLRLSGVAPDADVGASVLEALGPRWYRMAVASVEAHGGPVTPGVAVVERIGAHFGDARRVLNAVTDYYLYPLRERWFGAR